jgi:hypothetical protein
VILISYAEKTRQVNSLDFIIYHPLLASNNDCVGSHYIETHSMTASTALIDELYKLPQEWQLTPLGKITGEVNTKAVSHFTTTKRGGK